MLWRGRLGGLLHLQGGVMASSASPRSRARASGNPRPADDEASSRGESAFDPDEPGAAIVDADTGLAGGRAFAGALDVEVGGAERYGYPLSLAAFSIDDFQSYGARHGRVRSGERLRAIAALLRRGLRDLDLALRLGADEFAVILPHTDKGGALAVAERLRAAAADSAPGAGGGKESVAGHTLSIGVATFTEDGLTSAALIHAADQARFASIRQGKNRVSAAHRPRNGDAGPAVEAQLAWLQKEGRQLNAVLVDDNPPFQRAVAALLAPYAQISLVAIVPSLNEALQRCQRLRPHIVLLDVDWVELPEIGRLRQTIPQAKIIALSLAADFRFGPHESAAGIDDCVPKSSVFHDLVPAMLRLAVAEAGGPGELHRPEL